MRASGILASLAVVAALMRKLWVWGLRKLLQTHKKCVMKMKVDVHYKYFYGKKKFIRHVQKTHVMDNKELQINNS